MIPILSRCKDRIKYCGIHVSDDYFNLSDFAAPSPLILPKAKHVEIGDLYFCRQWTNDCTQLSLDLLENILIKIGVNL